MKRATPIDENDLSEVSGGVYYATRAVLNADDGCEKWNCNVCGNGLKSNYLSENTVPCCKHYAFTSCRNCQYFNAQDNTCAKKI